MLKTLIEVYANDFDQMNSNSRKTDNKSTKMPSLLKDGMSIS